MKHPILSFITLCVSLYITPVDARTHNHHKPHVSHNRHHTHIKPKHKVNPPKTAMTGIASWYGYESGPRYRRRPKTASGAYFSPAEFTAAHRTLPFGTKVKVKNMLTGESVIVTINDRGPFVHNRIIDLSKAAANSIGITGIEKVSLTVITG